MLKTILVLLLFPFMVHAQGIIRGTVLDDASQPLSGAHVLLKGANRGVIADTEGSFTFVNVPAGFYEIDISFIGYDTYTEKTEVKNGQVSQVNVTLQPGDVQLADVVVAATTQRPVNTLSAIDIQLRSTQTSQDILRMVPGLFIAQHAGGGKAEQIFLRGFDIDHGTDINLEVDGLPVNMVSHAHGQGYSDLHFLIPELVNLVDFDKGPYFADKGDLATAGYVNFQTKNILEKNFVKVEGGLFGTARTVAGVNIKSKGYIASEYFRSDGYFESPQDFNRFNIAGKYSAPFGKHNRFTFGASYFASNWDASGQIPERAVQNGTITRLGSLDNTEGGETGRSNIYGKIHHHVSVRSTIEQQLYFVHYDFNLFSNFTFFLNDSVNGDQIQQKESRSIYGYKATFNHTGSLSGTELNTEIGGGFRYDDVKDVSLSHTQKRNYLNDYQRGDIGEGNFNGYISETMNLDNAWSVQAAIRFDYFTFSYHNKLAGTEQLETASILSPKLSINYQLNAWPGAAHQ